MAKKFLKTGLGKRRPQDGFNLRWLARPESLESALGERRRESPNLKTAFAAKEAALSRATMGRFASLWSDTLIGPFSFPDVPGNFPALQK